MWAGVSIFGKWSDLHPIDRRLVSRRYLHAILPRWHHLSGSLLPSYRYPIHTLSLPAAGIVTLHATIRLTALTVRYCESTLTL